MKAERLVALASAKQSAQETPLFDKPVEAPGLQQVKSMLEPNPSGLTGKFIAVRI